ncbi:MAG: GspE/PulE family protein [Patescibacteria group bacterium]|nr:GspE/PulE family protein [Patescibacteria group bacterium]
MFSTKQKELLQLLIKEGKIKESKATELINEIETGQKKFDDVLIKQKIIEVEDLAKYKGQVHNLPYENLAEKEFKKDVLNIIPREVANNYNIICFEEKQDLIKIGLTDPDNFKAIEAVDFLAKGKGYKIEYYVISYSAFKKAVAKYDDADKELGVALEQRAAEEDELTTIEEKDSMELKEVTKSAPVAKIVSVIIRHAVEGEASDIHIEPLFHESRVRYRIDGVLHTSLVLPRSVHAAIVARIKVMSNLKLDETRIPQDGRIRMEIGDKVIDFRVSILPLMGAEKVVMRILDTTKGAPKLEDLGYQGQQLQAILDSSERTEGIILITGPTGSGKSTTIFSVLDLVNKEGVNIATLEDPVEYQMKGVNQSQIKPEIGYTFAAGLRSFLRQDPDIIMVGEIRDEETAELATHAALTGHLVLSTLHTTNASGAITRLVDMGVQSFLLGSTLVLVAAQRLARKNCEKCKEEYKMPEKRLVEIKQIVEEIGVDYVKKQIPDLDMNNLKFYHGKGCSHCGNSGYHGRLSVCEVLTITDEIKETIFGGKKHLTISDIRKSQQFVTVKQDGIIKVLQGITTLEEVYRIMRN